MLKVGITGGIGSGKTTVCRIFEILRIPIYYADDRAKAIMVTDKTIISGIQSIFGVTAYYEDGSLNRQHIAAVAFADESKLAALNALVHPAVRLDGDSWFDAQTEKPYALKEAALHFETGGYKLMDKMITVVAPEALRIRRVMQRDNISAEAVKIRIDKQLLDSEKVKLSDFVIYNDGSQSLVQQVVQIHKVLTNL